jgi:dTDP-4-dehydrorhamnose 3,5-epimerase
MNIIETGIKDLLVFEPRVFADDRGYFFETFNQASWPDIVTQRPYVQDNEAYSSYGVLRGLHYQVPPFAQAKLVRVVLGKVLDVVVDIRTESDTYGKSYAEVLSEENKRQMYVPRGFAHGYVVLSPTAIFCYKCDNYYSKEHEGGVYFNDPVLGIDWMIDAGACELSEKDKVQPQFGAHRVFK